MNSRSVRLIKRLSLQSFGIRLSLSVLVLLAFLFPARAGSSDVSNSSTLTDAQHATLAVQTLQTWYVPASGLYRKPTDWWNTANAITVLVDYSRVSHTTKYLGAVANTFAKANKTYRIHNFVNDSNDDEGWWALAWIDAYDLTKTASYLQMAETIFADMTKQWETGTCGGGVWWSKDLQHSAYKNAVTNELFLEISAGLANRVADPEKKAQYLAWAQKEWRWFKASGMVNAENLVNDGLNAKNPAACTNNHQTTWTYNQGVVLGGLVELAQADGDSSLLPQAEAIAQATIAMLVTPGGVLNEHPGGGPDLPQFKGVFMRNLVKLYRVAPRPAYRSFLRMNADSIWQKDQGENHKLGMNWQGPFDSGDATRQTSALDALIAAVEMEQR
jgi:predicted alpha-1,6-mannanase (GH76 family)